MIRQDLLLGTIIFSFQRGGSTFKMRYFYPDNANSSNERGGGAGSDLRTPLYIRQ
jgi:hypothetical protein